MRSAILYVSVRYALLCNLDLQTFLPMNKRLLRPPARFSDGCASLEVAFNLQRTWIAKRLNVDLL